MDALKTGYSYRTAEHDQIKCDDCGAWEWVGKKISHTRRCDKTGSEDPRAEQAPEVTTAPVLTAPEQAGALDALAAAKILAGAFAADAELGARVWAPNGSVGPVRVYVSQIHARKGDLAIGYIQVTGGEQPVTYKLDKWEVKAERIVTDALAGRAVEPLGEALRRAPGWNATDSNPRFSEDEDGNPQRTFSGDREGDEQK